MNKIHIAKIALRYTVQYGVGSIIAHVINNNVEPETTLDKVTVMAGSLAIAGVVAQACGTYTDQVVDEVVSVFKS